MRKNNIVNIVREVNKIYMLFMSKVILKKEQSFKKYIIILQTKVSFCHFSMKEIKTI